MINFPNPSSIVGQFRTLPLPSKLMGGVVLAVVALAIGIFKVILHISSQQNRTLNAELISLKNSHQIALKSLQEQLTDATKELKEEKEKTPAQTNKLDKSSELEQTKRNLKSEQEATRQLRISHKELSETSQKNQESFTEKLSSITQKLDRMSNELKLEKQTGSQKNTELELLHNQEISRSEELSELNEKLKRLMEELEKRKTETLHKSEELTRLRAKLDETNAEREKSTSIESEELSNLKRDLNIEIEELSNLKRDLNIERELNARQKNRSSNPESKNGLEHETQKLDLSWIEKKIQEFDDELPSIDKRLEDERGKLKIIEQAINELKEKIDLLNSAIESSTKPLELEDGQKPDENDSLPPIDPNLPRNEIEKLFKERIPKQLEMLSQAKIGAEKDNSEIEIDLQTKLSDTDIRITKLEEMLSEENDQKLSTEEIEIACEELIPKYSTKKASHFKYEDELTAEAEKAYRNKLATDQLSTVRKRKTTLESDLSENHDTKIENSRLFELFEQALKDFLNGIDYQQVNDDLERNAVSHAASIRELERRQTQIQEGSNALKNALSYLQESSLA